MHIIIIEIIVKDVYRKAKRKSINYERINSQEGEKKEHKTGGTNRNSKR